jgi:ribosomal protein S18 acetylase RimI-like enzyme
MEKKYFNSEIYIRKKQKDDADLVHDLMVKSWGGEPLVVYGKNYYPSKMDGILICQDKQVVGFLIYDKLDLKYEILVFEIFKKFEGIGTFVLNEFIEIAKREDCKKVVVMTTNDNLDALRFYQRRGFVITHIIPNALELSRKMKPNIPENGDYGIPIRDEIVLERLIDKE